MAYIPAHGDVVRVIDDCDSTQLRDQQSDDSVYMGRVGVVKAVVSRLAHCPVGESRKSPYIRVRFSDGVVDGFWPEELNPIGGA